MVLMPAACAFLRQADPDAESRFTMSWTLTPSLIMLSQIVANFDVSLSAFWMSEPMPPWSNAAFSSGLSFDSHRGDVVASGRITPTLPLTLPLDELPDGELPLDPPHATRTRPD